MFHSVYYEWQRSRKWEKGQECQYKETFSKFRECSSYLVLLRLHNWLLQEISTGNTRREETGSGQVRTCLEVWYPRGEKMGSHEVFNLYILKRNCKALENKVHAEFFELQRSGFFTLPRPGGPPIFSDETVTEIKAILHSLRVSSITLKNGQEMFWNLWIGLIGAIHQQKERWNPALYKRVDLARTTMKWFQTLIRL